MRKVSLIILTLIISLIMISCKDSGEDNTSEPVLETPNKITTPYIKTDKKVYKKGENIVVKLFNYDGCKSVSLTEYGREPSANHELTNKKVGKTNEVMIKTDNLETVGDFTLWLMGDEFYEYIYALDVHIDDEDETNYGIESAQLKQVYSIMSNDEYTAGYNRIIIKTNHKTELTYRLYWCKDGQRLSDYMALKTVKTADDNFNIELHEKLFKPKEANQIEIAVVEGVSESYYLDVTGWKDLSDSQYEFTFNAISDLHIQSKRDSLLFNAHLKKTLSTIYDSDSKAILAVGDIVNFGKESEYEFLQTIFDSVENPNNIGFYPAIGNHEVMYFSSMDEPLGYFTNHFNLDKQYYSFMLNGYKFIVLGNEANSIYGVMNNTQLQWLRDEISSVPKNQPIFIMIHQGLIDTVDGTLHTKYGQDDYGFINNNSLRSLLDSNPNLIVFSGHSHHTLEGEMPVNYTAFKATYVNCGSNSYLNQYFPSGSHSEIGGSEGLFVEVYEDYILIRGKEFCYNRWVANCQIQIPRNK